MEGVQKGSCGGTEDPAGGGQGQVDELVILDTAVAGKELVDQWSIGPYPGVQMMGKMRCRNPTDNRKYNFRGVGEPI